jgi:hypothetical protein
MVNGSAAIARRFVDHRYAKQGVTLMNSASIMFPPPPPMPTVRSGASTPAGNSPITQTDPSAGPSSKFTMSAHERAMVRSDSLISGLKNPKDQALMVQLYRVATNGVPSNTDEGRKAAADANKLYEQAASETKGGALPPELRRQIENLVNAHPTLAQKPVMSNPSL